MQSTFTITNFNQLVNINVLCSRFAALGFATQSPPHLSYSFISLHFFTSLPLPCINLQLFVMYSLVSYFLSYSFPASPSEALAWKMMRHPIVESLAYRQSPAWPSTIKKCASIDRRSPNPDPRWTTSDVCLMSCSSARTTGTAGRIISSRPSSRKHCDD